MTTNHCAMRLWRWGIVNSKIQVLEGQCSLPRSLGRLGPKNSPKSSKSRRISQNRCSQIRPIQNKLYKHHPWWEGVWDCNKTLMQGECQLNITEPSWKAAHTTGCTAGLCFNWESGHSKEVFLASQGNLLLVKESFQTANWDSSLSRETALCKVASLGSKWFKVHTLPVLHDIHIATGTITHLCRGQTLRPRLSGRWMTGRSRVVYVLLLKAPQNRNI